MLGVPPHNCSICYQAYNNYRSPLILITCGHTFCKECIEMIFLDETTEIPCPECKQSTYVLEPSCLPKNRTLLDVIIYHEGINRSIKQANLNNNKKKEINLDEIEDKFKNDDPNKTNKSYDSKTQILLLEYENILNQLEETYNKILEEHSYLTEISDVLITKEVDEALDNLIDIINDYRSSLHNKIKNEFKKVNLIKEFKTSLNMYKSKFQLHSSKLISNSGRKKNEIIVNHENIEQGVNKDEIKIDIEENSLTDENKENTNTKQALNNITDNYSFTQFEIDNLNNEIKFAK